MAGYVFANRVFDPYMGDPAALQGVVVSVPFGGAPTFRLAGRSNVRPSYQSGFSRSASQSAYPGLWKQCALFYDPLGKMVTGYAPNLVSKQYGGPSFENMESTDYAVDQRGVWWDLGGTDEGIIPPLAFGQNVIHLATAFSFSCWYQPDQIAGNATLFGGWTSNAAIRHVLVRQIADGAMQFFTFTSGQIGGTFTAPAFAAGTSVHVCCTYDGNTMRTYVDGVESTTTFTQTGLIGASQSDFAGTDQVIFGNDAGASGLSMDGKFKSIGVWTRALQLDEVRTLYRDDLAPFQLQSFLPINTTPTFDSFCLDNSELYYPGSTESELYSPGAAESQIGC